MKLTQYAALESDSRVLRVDEVESADERAVEQLLLATRTLSTEDRHGRADEILCELLDEIGCPKTAAKFRELARYFWYA